MIHRQSMLFAATARSSFARGAPAATAAGTPSPAPMEDIPVFLKPSRSARRRSSFYIPRMRETQPDAATFHAGQLGSALPLFAITSNTCEYFALRLPLLNAGFKRLPLTGGVVHTACNVVWGKSPRYAQRPGAPAGAGNLAGYIVYAPPPPIPCLNTAAAFQTLPAAQPSSIALNNPLQRFNHYPGSHKYLGCKRGMAKNIQQADRVVRAATPTSPSVAERAREMYAFSPKTWFYPEDREAMVQAFRAAPADAHFIWKPARGSCGRGILLSRGGERNADSWKQVMREIAERSTNEVFGRFYRQYVVQEYLQRPLLLNGRKMDLRLYVAVTSYDPLTVYLHEEGLVRLAAERYSAAGAAVSLASDSCIVAQEGPETEGAKRGGLLSATQSAGTHATSDPSFDALFGAAVHTPAPDATASAVLSNELLAGRFRHLTNYSVGRKYQAVRELERQRQHIQGAERRARLPTFDTTSPVGDARTGAEEGRQNVDLELKWSLQKLWDHLDAELARKSGPANKAKTSTVVKESVALLITRTLLAARPSLLRSDAKVDMACGYFELYGFDVMLDEQCDPFLIEINTLPSLESSSDFDYATKCNVVSDLLNLAMMEPFARNPATLQPFTNNMALIQPPSAVVTPYVKQVGELGVPLLSRLSADEQKTEIVARLEDELCAARGFKRIFPPLTASEASRHGAPLTVDSPAVVQDLTAYAGLRMLTPYDEVALNL